MSPNGIWYLLSSAESLGIKAELKKNLAKTVTMAVGPKTAQELKTHIPVSLVPAKQSSEGIIEWLLQLNISGKSNTFLGPEVLLPSSQISLDKWV